MKKRTTAFALAATFLFMAAPGHAQLMKKLKDKVADATNKVINNKIDPNSDSQGNTTNTSSQPGNTSSGKPVNKGGAGLKNTPPPDVLQQMNDAETANKASNYTDARYSLQQALMGVELQLGRKVLLSLPATVNNLPKDSTQDLVSSSQWGWSNLTMQRVYKDGKDKQLTVTIGNNALYMGFVNMYFNNSMVQADASQQNVKHVKVKGNKSLIQYDDSKGYTLITPIGQTSMIVWECINFSDENEVMRAAENFDIDGIKKTLGEQ
ncbi:MAG: hypothetical protein V4717_07885 [Bacteroidota bacterium]